jgi:23S rRNA pseudouridine955/2504/2580 synthase
MNSSSRSVVGITTDSSKTAHAVQQLIIDVASEGQRLDNFLLRVLKGVPKTHVYRIIRAGEVRVNKGRVQAETRLAIGDVVRVPPVRMSARGSERMGARAGMSSAAEEAEFADNDMKNMGLTHIPPQEFAILFEDDHFLAIDKPAGIAVHGGSGVSFGVIEQLRRARGYGHVGGAKFLELVHRLDKETSGVLLIAKRRSALVALQAQFKDRTASKTYLALVKGAWPEKLKVIDQPLHKYLVNGGEDDGERRVKVVAKDNPDGMRAITLVKVREIVKLPDGSTATQLEVTIKTGRTHQIRVHLASNGHPIIGDEKYGDFALNKQLAKLGMKRMYLHAWRLAVTHPATNASIELLSTQA